MSKRKSTIGTNSTIGERLKLFAEQYFGTKYAMARELGISQSNFAKYCNGQLPIGKTVLKRLTDAGVSEEWLVYGTGEMATEQIHTLDYTEKEKGTHRHRIRVQGIFAGTPLALVDEHAVSEMDLGVMADNRKDFAVRVSGNTMLESGIRDGDLLVMTATKTAKDNEVVSVTDPEGQLTLKRLKQSGKQFLLTTDDKNQKPVVMDSTWKITGVFKALIRGKL